MEKGLEYLEPARNTSKHNKARTSLQLHLFKLEREFDLVVITEHFDRSLLLLRRKLCWDITDMVYISMKKASYKQNKKLNDLKTTKNNQQMNERYRFVNPIAYKLYSYFNKSLFNRFQMKHNLEDELQFFLRLKDRVAQFCSRYIEYIQRDTKNFLNIINTSDVMNVPASKWGKARTIDPVDCAMMQLQKFTFQEISLMKEIGINGIRSIKDIPLTIDWSQNLSHTTHPKYGIPLSLLTDRSAYDFMDKKI